MPLTKLNHRALSGTITASQMPDLTHGEVGTAKHPGIVYHPTNTVFRKCTQIADLVSYWKWSGNMGARTSAPSTVASDTVFSNFNYDTSSWKIVRADADNYVDTANSDNFYWYISKLVYLEAGLYSFEGDKDDDHVWYFVPETGSAIFAGGDITDNDGANAGAYNSNNISVSTSGFYRWVGRGIDGGGGNKLRLMRVTQGLDRIWVPTSEHPRGTVIDYQSHQRTDVITTDSQSGVVALETPGIYNKTFTSTYKINAVVSGHSGDDSQVEWQYSKNNGSSYTSLGSMGDHAWTHRSNNGAISLGYNYEFQPHANVDDLVKVRCLIKSENNNQGGFHLNRGIDPQPSGFNADSSTSCLQVQEII